MIWLNRSDWEKLSKQIESNKIPKSSIYWILNAGTCEVLLFKVQPKAILSSRRSVEVRPKFDFKEVLTAKIADIGKKLGWNIQNRCKYFRCKSDMHLIWPILLIISNVFLVLWAVFVLISVFLTLFALKTSISAVC